MADFCRQCAEEMWPPDADPSAFKDLAGLVTEAEFNDGMGASALCEGCGPTVVDHEGRCLGPCLRHHGKFRTESHTTSWII